MLPEWIKPEISLGVLLQTALFISGGIYGAFKLFNSIMTTQAQRHLDNKRLMAEINTRLSVVEARVSDINEFFHTVLERRRSP